MRFPEASHMADDGEAAPVWARRSSRGSGGGNPFVALIFAILALAGALTIGLAIWDKSFAAAGARIDGWIAPVVSQIGKLTGKAAEEGEEVAAESADTVGDAAEAVQEDVAAAADSAKK